MNAINFVDVNSINKQHNVCKYLHEEVKHGSAPFHVHPDDPLGGQYNAHVHAALEEVHGVKVVVVAGNQVGRRVTGNRGLREQ